MHIENPVGARHGTAAVYWVCAVDRTRKGLNLAQAPWRFEQQVLK